MNFLYVLLTSAWLQGGNTWKGEESQCMAAGDTVVCLITELQPGEVPSNPTEYEL